MVLIDITQKVGQILENKGYGDDRNDELNIKKSGIWDLMNALSKTDNSKFSVEQAETELKRRGV